MSWETVNVNDIDLDAKPQPVPAGTYTLQIAGARMSTLPNRAGQTDVILKVADPGENLGRTIFLEIPDPDAQSWAGAVYARLVKATGETVAPYTPPVEELNRIATNGHARFLAEVFIETFKKRDGSDGAKNKVAVRSIRPAA